MSEQKTGQRYELVATLILSVGDATELPNELIGKLDHNKDVYQSDEGIVELSKSKLGKLKSTVSAANQGGAFDILSEMVSVVIYEGDQRVGELSVIDI